MIMTETKSLVYQYPNGKQFRFPDFVLNSGEKALISGKSGSGKTTLLHLLAGILRPSSGEIIIEQQALHSLGESGLDRFRNQNTGLIFQQHLFLKSLTMSENLAIARSLAGKEQDNDWKQKLMQALSIEQLQTKKPEQLSQGELQRFSLARALINRPALLLADEPTSSLDDKNFEQMIQLLHTLEKLSPFSMLIATHDSRLKNVYQSIVSL